MYFALKLKHPSDQSLVGGECLVVNVDPPHVWATVHGKPREVARIGDKGVPYLRTPWDRDRVGQLVLLALQKLADPHYASQCAQNYYELTRRCARCGRRITSPESVQRGVGPECAKKGGRIL